MSSRVSVKRFASIAGGCLAAHLIALSCDRDIKRNSDNASFFDTSPNVENVENQDVADGGTASEAPMPLPTGRSLLVSRFAVDVNGKTVVIQSDVPAGTFWIAVRVAPDPIDARAAYCFQIEEVADALGTIYVARSDTRREWGRVCNDCSQRVSVGEGYGWFVFPNDGKALPFYETLSFRVAVRDCETLLPAASALGDRLPEGVLVEVVTGLNPQTDHEPTLDLLLAHTADSLINGRDAEEWVASALDEARKQMKPSGITLRVSDTINLPEASGDVTFSSGNMIELNTLYNNVRTYAAAQKGIEIMHRVPVIFVGCLSEEDVFTGEGSTLLARTVRIPGGGQTGIHADGIFVATASCSVEPQQSLWTSPSSMGKVLTHELGHYLGLYHSVESDGAKDHLEDTSENNLMHYQPSLASATGLSPSQVEVMRRHPSLIYTMQD